MADKGGGGLRSVNAKGADAFICTTEPLVDLFTRCSKNPYMSLEEFTTLLTELHAAMNSNPESFLKLLKFHRSIKAGNGIKQYYYLGMTILKVCSAGTLYREMLDWTYQYAKDLHQMSRLTAGLQNAPLGCAENHDQENEVTLYASKVHTQLKKLLKAEQEGSDPMIFKYLSHEGGHWDEETQQVWRVVDRLLLQDTELEVLLTTASPLECEAGNEIRALLREQIGKGTFITRRVARKIKVAVDSTLHLTDYLLAGVHYSGQPFDCAEENQAAEVELVAKEISQSSGIATTNLLKTLAKKAPERRSDEGEEEVEVISPVRQLLRLGYTRYREMLASKEIVAKEVGQDLSAEVWRYFREGIDETGLESKLTQRIERVRNKVMPMFTEEFTVQEFIDSFVIIVDRSGSMGGSPLQNACLHMLIMAKLFRVKEVLYFENSVAALPLTDADLDGPILELVRKVYTRDNGGTDLMVALRWLEQAKAGNKNVVIITDSDCDPSSFGTTESPFHAACDPSAFAYLPTNRYIVMNVKETTMSFPYLSFHPNVAYVSGVGCLEFLVQSMIRSRRDKQPLTANLVLECCFDAEENQIPDHIEALMAQPTFFAPQPITAFSIDDMYRRWMTLVPKQKKAAEPINVGDIRGSSDEDDEEGDE